MRYYWPCMANPITPEHIDKYERNTMFVAEIKKNGWRCLVEKDGPVTLWTRHHTLIEAKSGITKTLTDIKATLNRLPELTILDSEILLTNRVKGMPSGLYLFDILVYKGELLFTKPLIQRKVILESVYREFLISNPVIELAVPVQIGKRMLYEQAIADPTGISEGIVIKALTSPYVFGINKSLDNPFWIKCKALEKHVKTGGE
jgi:ATP-dependent DNA ligase